MRMDAVVLLFWAGVVVLGVGVSAAGVMAIGKWRGQQPGNAKVVKDSENFREILWKWESFVLERGGTVRGVKRFANRARFMTSGQGRGEGGSSVEAVVAFIALEQCELMKNCTSADFEKWRSEILSGAGLPEGWTEWVTKEQWESYKETVGSSRE